MSAAALAVPTTPLAELAPALATRGHALLAPADFARFVASSVAELDAFRPSWDALPPDAHLRDGGRYRRRRHASFVVENGAARLVAPRAHWQPVEYNALHGGLERWFEPIEEGVVAAASWQRMLVAFAALASAAKGVHPWFVEAHQISIDTTDGIGRPTPEGAHRDGVDFVVVVLVGREGIKGGETRVFAADGPAGLRFTMLEPWTALVLDDARVIHETTPVQPLEGYGHRDTLVLTYRAGSFQGPAAS
jgi:hypothetical protein